MTSSTPQRTTRSTARLGEVRELPKGGLRPAAQPLSSFFAPGRIAPAAPAKPSVMPEAPRFSFVRQGSGGNVAGANPGFQVAEALSRFNQNLTTTLNAGLKVYASSEYQKGQNEIWKAYTLSTDDQLLEGEAYAKENRQLARRDPIAGVMMDQVNPFRAGGRMDAVSRIAAAEIGPAMLQDYRDNATELASLDPGDPRINAIKGRAVARVMSRFGITEWTPGFAKHVLPNLNRAWERVTAQQFEDRTRFLKSTIPQTAAVEIVSKILRWRNENVEPSQQIRAIENLLDIEARRLGLPGEAMWMKGEAIKRARALLEEDGQYEAAEMLFDVGVGPPNEEGIRVTAGGMFNLELLESDDRVAGMRMRMRQRDEEILLNGDGTDENPGLLNVLSERVGFLPDGPGKHQEALNVINDPRWAAIPYHKRLEAINQVTRTVDPILERQYVTPEAIEEFFFRLEGGEYGFGSQRKLDKAEKDFRALLDRISPEERPRYLRRFNDYRNQQQFQPWDLINPIINDRVKTTLAQLVPGLEEAALQGVTNIEQLLAFGDAQQRQITGALVSQMRQKVLADLDRHRSQKKRELTDAEANQVIRVAVWDVAKEAMENPGSLGLQLPPAGSGGNSIDMARQINARRQAQSEQVQTYPPGSLQTMPDRQERLAQWRNTPVLSAQGTDMLFKSAVIDNIGFPREFRRFAADAGTTPERLLLQQMELYPNDFQITPAMRNRLLNQGNRSKAADDWSISQTISRVGSALGRAGGWLADALLGTAPANAATMPVELEVTPAPQPRPTPRPTPRPAPRPAPRPRQPAGPRPQPVSHPEIGQGYTLPGLNDAYGRPVVLSVPALQTLPAMIRDSGGQFKTSDIASSQRSPAKNASLGAAAHPNSGHMYGEKLDMSGSSAQWMRDHGHKYGWRTVYHMGGGAWDFEYVGTGARSPLAKAGDTSATNQLAGDSSTSGTRALLSTSTRRIAQPSTRAIRRRRALMRSILGDSYELSNTARAEIAGVQHTRLIARGGNAGTMRNTYSSGGDFKTRYFTRMAFLESTLDPGAFNSEGSGARGYFQLTGSTERDLIRRGHSSIVQKMKSNDLATAIQGAYEYARLQHPEVDQLLAAGDVDGLDRLLRGLWVSLPGGSQPQLPERYEQANRYLTD